MATVLQHVLITCPHHTCDERLRFTFAARPPPYPRPEHPRQSATASQRNRAFTLLGSRRRLQIHCFRFASVLSDGRPAYTPRDVGANSGPAQPTVTMRPKPLPAQNHSETERANQATQVNQPSFHGSAAIRNLPVATVAPSTARLAQSAERKALNPVVVGSGPTVGVFGLLANARIVFCESSIQVRNNYNHCNGSEQ